MTRAVELVSTGFDERAETLREREASSIGTRYVDKAQRDDATMFTNKQVCAYSTQAVCKQRRRGLSTKRASRAS